MTNDDAYQLAKTAGVAGSARVELSNKVLGNARMRAALRAKIMRHASVEQRALVERFFPDAASGAAWDLLFAIAGEL
jgi:hypothetical protein